MLDENKLYTLLKQFESRIETLEDSVNNTLIGGLKEAANTYIDNENYGIFGDKYGSAIDEVAPDLAIIMVKALMLDVLFMTRLKEWKVMELTSSMKKP